MAMWKFTITNGTTLREAIEDGNSEATIEALIVCFKELYSKMSTEDKEYYEFDIEDHIEILSIWNADENDDEDIDYHLEEFYDICDSVRAFVAL